MLIFLKVKKKEYDFRLRRLISDFKLKVSSLHIKHGQQLNSANNVSHDFIYSYFCARRVSFMIFNKANLFFIRIYDKLGRKCVNKCCNHKDFCQGALLPHSQLGVYLKDTASFPYYFFHYYKCRFVQYMQKDNTGQTSRRELFFLTMQFVTDVKDILEPHLVKPRYIPNLESLLADCRKNGYYPSGVAFRINGDLTQLRQQIEANEGDHYDEQDEHEQLFKDL